MIFYVTVGGMKGTTWVQIVKAVLLMTGTILITILVLAKFDFNLSELLGAAAQNTGKGEAFLQPGLKYGLTTTSKIDFLSLGLALVLGTAGLPHILIRFYTVPTAKDARTSVQWAIGLIGAFYLMTLALGFGAAALLDTGPDSQVAASGGNLASPLLAEAVGGGDGSTGGAILLALISAVAFATILAVVAGLTLTSASSVAHDLYATVTKRGQATEKDEVKVAKVAAFVIGAIAIALAIPAQKLNIAFLVALAFAVAASANLPSIIYNLFWKRFNTRGATWAIYGGLISCVVPRVLLPGRLRPGGQPGHRREPVAVPGRRGLPLVPAAEPRHHLHPAGLLLRLARDGDVQGAAPPRTGSPSSRSAPSPAPAPSRPPTTRDPGGAPIRLRIAASLRRWAAADESVSGQADRGRRASPGNANSVCTPGLNATWSGARPASSPSPTEPRSPSSSSSTSASWIGHGSCSLGTYSVRLHPRTCRPQRALRNSSSAVARARLPHAYDDPAAGARARPPQRRRVGADVTARGVPHPRPPVREPEAPRERPPPRPSGRCRG